MKGGIVHAHAPVDVLEGSLAVRVHLDDCGPENGALRVIPGTHRSGKLSPAVLEEKTACARDRTLECRRGDLLLMRPFLMHASSPARIPTHRRVLHIEYSSASLPPPLQWFLGWPIEPD